jgi:TolA-binding protein
VKHSLTIAAIVVLLTVTHPARVAASCSSGDAYTQALCSFTQHDYNTASQRFEAIVGRGETVPETIKSIYFLARTDMKMGRWTEASSLLTRIYSIAPGFYREWNCDFLLGQCRRALGKD